VLYIDKDEKLINFMPKSARLEETMGIRFLRLAGFGGKGER
jgi:hypothetical protein